LFQNGWFRNASLDAKQVTIVTNMFVDDRYVSTLGMQMVKGRNFDINVYPSDSSAIIINESAAQLLGMKEPLHQLLYRPGEKMVGYPFHIVGVVKDFNFNSLHEKVGPMILQFADNRGMMAIRIKTANVFPLVAEIERQWKKMAPGVPMSYTFMDADFNKLYHAEQQTGKLFITFAVFAIVIACLGLFGLVTYAAEQRTKEIGIRKVLGAKVGGIVTLLSKDFTRLVIIAALIAFPVAWWAMEQWLHSFAYRATISWWIFVIAGGTAILIALLTVSFQTIRAAIANPVKSLRSE
ncbi:MAG TPA: FtsX-like permease family protein, partial [Puia sp.]|nr:FtsX-like permease family protein [Puia sp.]